MGKRVLVVDDHEILRTTVCSMLRAQGFEVSEADNGVQAIEKAQQICPHLVILDLAMPLMNGLEAARMLKILMPNLPLLMFTNTTGLIMERDARAAGIGAVVCKSDSAERLLAQVRTLLN